MFRKIIAIVALSSPLLVCAEPLEFDVVSRNLNSGNENNALRFNQARMAIRAEANAAQKAKAEATGVTEDDVGEVESFGRAKTYIGLRSTDRVVVQADCTGFDPDTGICVETDPAPAATFVDVADVGSLSLPGKATNSLMCFTVTQFSTWLWANTTAAQATGDMNLRLTVQIENDALLGLSDANGTPFNGLLFPAATPIQVSGHQHTLPAGAFEIQRERTTRSCTGGFVSARSLAARGLTDAQIKDFFKTPMTVHFGVQGTVALVDFATFFLGVRLYGD